MLTYRQLMKECMDSSEVRKWKTGGPDRHFTQRPTAIFISISISQFTICFIHLIINTSFYKPTSFRQHAKENGEAECCKLKLKVPYYPKQRNPKCPTQFSEF